MKNNIFMNFLTSILLMLWSCTLFAQFSETSITGSLPASFFKGRREALRQMMPPNSVFVLFASPEKTFSGDVDYVYHQNPDMYYFSGYPEPNSMMYIFKENQTVTGIESPFNEIIFTPPADSRMIRYTGKKAGKEEAMKKLGIQLALETTRYEEFPLDLSRFNTIIIDLIPAEVRDNGNMAGLSGLIKSFIKKADIPYIPDSFSLTVWNYITEFKNDAQQKAFIQQVKTYLSNQPNKIKIDSLLSRYLESTDSLTRSQIRDSVTNFRINYRDYDRFTSTLRQIKTDEEIAAIRKAVEITCNGHTEVMKAVTPEMSEREIQGIHEFMYKKGGAKEIGFPLIIASGNNGCILHYQDNDKPAVGDSLVLMDVGAMFSGYSGDVTRTIPSKGKFSPEQLAIYKLVLAAQDSVFSECRSGTSYLTLNIIGSRVIARGLKELGLIEDLSQVSRYYPHGISHSVGLDVHDKSLQGAPLANGMIITLEPGIYIPVGSSCDKKWWGIAVRIEDDILIKNNNPENLSVFAPRKPEEIERLMKKSSPFNQIK